MNIIRRKDFEALKKMSNDEMLMKLYNVEAGLLTSLFEFIKGFLKKKE